MDEIQALFTAIRESCSTQNWSRGIELVRARAIAGQTITDNEIELRIKTAGGTIASTVTLYPPLEEWECDCNSTADSCEHVAAAAIALRQARQSGNERLPTGRS